MPFILRGEDDTANPIAARLYGKGVTAPRVMYYRKNTQGARTGLIALLAEGARRYGDEGCDGIEHVFYAGFELPEFDSLGNRNWKFYPGNMVARPTHKAVTAVDAGANSLAVAAHGYATDTTVEVFSRGGDLPAPLAEGVTYYAINNGTDSVKLAAAAGGAEIDLTTAGTGSIYIFANANVGFNDPVQGNSWLFPELKWAGAGIAHIDVLLPEELSDGENEPSRLKVIMRGKRVKTYTRAGNSLVEGAFEYSTNGALCLLDIYTGDLKRPLSRFHAETWVDALIPRCDGLLDWEGGNDGTDNVTWAGVSNFTAGDRGDLVKQTADGWDAIATSISYPAGTKIKLRVKAGLGTFGIGFATSSTPGATPDTAVFSLQPNTASNQVTQKGSGVSHVLGSWAVGDAFTIEIEDDGAGGLRFTASQNSNTLPLVTIPAVPNAPLFVIVWGFSNGAGIDEASITPAGTAATPRQVKRFPINLGFPSLMQANDAAALLWARMPGCGYQDVNGRIKVYAVPDRPVFPKKLIFDPSSPTKSNVLNFSVAERHPDTKFNFFSYIFRNQDHRLLVKGPPINVDRPLLRKKFGLKEQPVINLVVMTESHAQRIAESAARLDVDLEPFYTVDASFDMYGLAKEDFCYIAEITAGLSDAAPALAMVVEERFKFDGVETRQFICQAITPDFYADSMHGPVTALLPSTLISPFAPPPPLASFLLSQSSELQPDNSFVLSINGLIEFTPFNRQQARIYWKRPSAPDYEAIDQPVVPRTGLVGSFVLTGVEAGTHWLKIVTETQTGVPSLSYVEDSIAVEAPEVPPAAEAVLEDEGAPPLTLTLISHSNPVLTASRRLTFNVENANRTLKAGELEGLSNLATIGFMKRTGARSYTTVGTISLASDVSGSLPWASVDKTGSSLADLTTRSASDLSSGTLAEARLPATVVLTSRTITEGAGLAGNTYDLSANRTLAMGTPSSLGTGTDNSASGTTHSHAIDATIARSAITITAGAGLTGGGDLSANRTISMGTPATLGVSSANSASGTTHTHAITSSANPGTAASLLASDPSGYLQLVRLGIGTAPTQPLEVAGNVFINSATANLFLKDTSTGFQSASSTVLTPQANNSIRATNYTSGLIGWNISAGGNAEFNNVDIRGAIHAGIFVYNALQATAGTQIITPSAAKLRSDVTVTAGPTYGTTTFTIDVVDQDGLSHAASQLFAVNDILRLKDGLVGDTWFKVTAVADQTTFWRYTASIQAGSANVTYRAGAGVPDYKQSGNGFIILTADQTNAPYIQMATHAGTFSSADANGTLVVTPELRIGNLNGSYGFASNVFGLGAGQYGVAGKSWVIVDGTNGVRIGNNTTTKISLDTAGNASFTGSITASSGTIAGWTINAMSLTKNEVTIAAGQNISAIAGTGEAWFGKSATGYYGLFLKGTSSAYITIAAGNSLVGSNGRPYLEINDGTYRRVMLGELNYAWGADGASNSMGMKVWNASGARIVEFSDVRNEISGWTVNTSNFAKDTGTDSTSAGMAPADYPFFAGATVANRAAAPYRVTPAGALFASNATITGAITATSGSFTGTVSITGVGKIVVGSDLTFDTSGLTMVGYDAFGGVATPQAIKWSHPDHVSAPVYIYGSGSSLYLTGSVATTKSTQVNVHASSGSHTSKIEARADDAGTSYAAIYGSGASYTGLTVGASTAPNAKLDVRGDAVVTGLLKAGSSPITLTNAAGKILSAAFDTAGTPQFTRLGVGAAADGTIPLLVTGTNGNDAIKTKGQITMYSDDASAPHTKFMLSLSALINAPFVDVQMYAPTGAGSEYLRFNFKNSSGSVLTEVLSISRLGALRISQYGAGTLVTDASGNISASSDERLKIIDGFFLRGLESLRHIRPVTYRWRPGFFTEDTLTQYVGFTTQNIGLAIPEAVFNGGRFQNLWDRGILATLVNSALELDRRDDHLQAQISVLLLTIKRLEARVQILERKPKQS